MAGMTRTAPHLRPTIPVAAGPRRLCELLDAIFDCYEEADLWELLRSVLHHAVDLTEARDGGIAVFDDPHQRVLLLATPTAADSEEDELIELPASGPVPVRLHAVRRDPSNGADLDDTPTNPFLGVPIWNGDTVFGNVYLTDKATAEVFSDVDEQLVVALAAAAGLAIANLEHEA
jgi:GAF domain-containing protein